METDEDRRQEAKDQEYQAIWGVGRESGQSKAEAINAMMMIIAVGSNAVTSSSVAAAESTWAAHHKVFQGTSDGWARQRETDGLAKRTSQSL
jgi:hypothetical protein